MDQIHDAELVGKLDQPVSVGPSNNGSAVPTAW
jgi:hypothetical protein